MYRTKKWGGGRDETVRERDPLPDDAALHLYDVKEG